MSISNSNQNADGFVVAYPGTADLPSLFRAWLAHFDADSPLVFIPVFNAYDDVIECINSVLTHTPAQTPILIIDDASDDERIRPALEALAQQRGFAYIRKTQNSGFVGSVNLAFRLGERRDIVVLNSDVIVPPDWLTRLRAAAYYRSTIATATPLTNNGTLVSVPYRNKPTDRLFNLMTTDEADRCIQRYSLQLRPIIPTAIGHCTYFKRNALDRVGLLDEAFAPGYGEEVDFSQRAVLAGFSHVVADDLFVFHKGARSFNERGRQQSQELRRAHERLIADRYPWYHLWVLQTQNSQTTPLALAIERARSALIGDRIAIDTTYFDGSTTGTNVLAIELVHALALTKPTHVELTVILPNGVSKEILRGIDQYIDHVISPADLYDHSQPMFDLVHRPLQVRTQNDLDLLHLISRRCVISYLDFIAFANPGYAISPDTWNQYQQITRLAFETTDGIVFNSADVAHDGHHQGLSIPSERSCISYNGVNHQLHRAMAHPPIDAQRLASQPFMLVLGTNFKHKNRVFALKLFHALLEKYAWAGHLIIAGPSVSGGGSELEEADELARHPQIRARIDYRGSVSDGEKQWLIEQAALVLYPSIYEGFGLVPFEAAAVGTPALTTRSTALVEVLGDQVLYLDTLDPWTGVDVVWALLSSPEVAHRQVEAIKARGLNFTWHLVAEKLWTFYAHILALPIRPKDVTLGDGTQSAHDLADVLEAMINYTSPPPPTRLRVWSSRARRMAYLWRTSGFGAVRERGRLWLRRRRARRYVPR